MAAKVRELTRQQVNPSSGWTGDQLVRAKRLWNSMQHYKRAAHERIEWLY